MTPYDTRNQHIEGFSHDESEETLDDTMVYLSLFYFYSYNLQKYNSFQKIKKKKNDHIPPEILFLFVFELKRTKV